MESIVAALREQQDELDALLGALDYGGWATPTPTCPGWTVADVVLHLAQTDELGMASADGTFATFLAAWSGPAVAGVDDAAGAMVERERGEPGPAVLARWRAAAAAERSLLAACDPGQRLPWVAGDLAARSLATTRLAETWIHSTDVAAALGITLEPTARLWHIARLAWRTLPYAFTRAGRTLTGDVAVSLKAPDGTIWDFGEVTEAVTTVHGPALEFCLVAGRRLDPSETSLVARGPDAEAVLALVRTYA